MYDNMKLGIKQALFRFVCVQAKGFAVRLPVVMNVFPGFHPFWAAAMCREVR